MSIGIYGTLHVAKEALFAQQSGVGVTAHNLANVNTPGYSRQRAVIETMPPQMIGGMYFGRGARVEFITKSYDKFLNNNIALEKNIFGGLDAKETYLKRAESLFNESSAVGVNKKMNRFWSAWEDMANHPEGIPERAILENMGEDIATNFRMMARELEEIRADANNRIQTLINTVNRLTGEIAALNQQILGTESQQTNANDLTDQRTRKFEELSEIIDVRAIESGFGKITVMTSGGKPLVAENVSFNLSVGADVTRDNHYAIYYNQGSERVDITDKITGGRLKGLLDIRDITIPKYLQQLNQMASSFVTEVNRTHYIGYGLDGSTGNFFFDPALITLAADRNNQGDTKIYDSEIIDPTQLVSSEFDINFISSVPQDSRYTIYDTLNENYLYRIDAGNSTITFNDGGDDHITISISHGTFNGNDIAKQIQNEMNANASGEQSYLVTYNESTRGFTITNKGTNELYINMSEILGFTNQRTTITAGVNDRIVFNEDGGPDETIELTAGSYSPEQLAVEIKTQLDDNSPNNQTYTVVYNKTARKFEITNNVGNLNIEIKWEDSNAARTLGFNPTNVTIGDNETQSSNTAPYTQIVSSNGSISSNTEAGTYIYAAQIYQIKSGANDRIVFNEDGGPDVTINLTAGVYSPDELAAEIQNQLDTNSPTGQTYSVSFDKDTQKFEIKNNGANDVTINWANSTAARTLGFTTTPTSTLLASGGTANSDTGRYVQRTFDISAGVNDKLIFDDGGIGDGSDPLNPTHVTATLMAGKYTGEELAAEIKRALENTYGGSGQEYIVTFDSRQGAFSIINANNNHHTLDISFSTSSAATILGFSADVSIAVNASDSSVNTAGKVVNYDRIDFYGMAFKIADDTALPERRDTLTVSTIKNAAINMAMDSVTATDPKKIATALRAFDIDGSNNTILFNDAANFGTTTHSKVVIPNGRYTPEELAKEIERQLEANGSGQSYKVHYDSETSKFNIANNPDNTNELFILWESEQTSADFVLGFDKKIFSVDTTNNSFEFTEGGVSTYTVNIPKGLYSGEELAEAVQKQMNLLGSNDYSVAYNTATREFTFTNNGDDNAALDLNSQIVATLGFSAANNPINSGASTTSDFTPGGLTAGNVTTGNFTTGIPQVGDNRNALDIADIKNLKVLMDETLTFDTFHSIIVSGLGNDVSINSETLNNQQFMIDQYEQRRQAISGVSLDEEMINLIKYQQAFTASAKMIATLDRMLDTIISMR